MVSTNTEACHYFLKGSKYEAQYVPAQVDRHNYFFSFFNNTQGSWNKNICGATIGR